MEANLHFGRVLKLPTDMDCLNDKKEMWRTDSVCPPMSIKKDEIRWE